jgi:hypothetical protein
VPFSLFTSQFFSKSKVKPHTNTNPRFCVPLSVVLSNRSHDVYASEGAAVISNDMEKVQKLNL